MFSRGRSTGEECSVTPALSSRFFKVVGVPLTALSLAFMSGCGSSSSSDLRLAEPDPRIAEGKEVFSFETFGNERFWTDAMQLPQGIAGAGVTPLDALALGLNVNVGALSAGTAEALLDALDQINAGTSPADTVLANPAVTLALINEGAVIGVVPFAADGRRKPLGSDASFNPEDSLDLGRGDKVGVTCALCHARTDDSIVPAGFAGPGSVGAQVDGITAKDLDVGAIFAASANPLAYLPFLQMQFETLDGATIGKGDSTGIPATGSIEERTAAARAYLTGTDAESGERYYPLTHFDATPDGIGNASYTQPFYRTDLAGPWGHSGSFAELNDFNNLVYSVALDPTSLLTDEGKAFLNVLAGPVGDEIAAQYQQVLIDTGVLSAGLPLSDQIPLVDASTTGIDAGSPTGPTGVRVSDDRLMALKVYTDQLDAPAAPAGLDPALIAQGEQIFQNARPQGANCAGCHTLNPNEAVRPIVVGVESMYRRYNDELLVLLERDGLSDVQTTLAGPRPSYDNSLIVLDASVRGAERGLAKPLLLGLDQKNVFLHDGAVTGVDAKDALDNLFNPARGPDAPHPFYFPRTAADETVDTAQGRAALVEYLRSRTATTSM